MRYLILILTVSLIIFGCKKNNPIIQNKWNIIANGTVKFLWSVYFVNENIGYATGTKGTIVKTIDGGKNWILQNSRTISDLHSIYFINANIGYTCGNAIYKTIDGGLNWKPQTDSIYGFNSIYFLDSINGYAVSGWYSETSKIFKTVNGGTTWTESLVNSSLLSIFFVDKNTGYGVGFYGAILKTIDGGATWNSQTISNYQQTLFSVFFTDSNNGYAVGVKSIIGPIDSDSSIIFKTIDGGTTWTSHLNGMTNWLYSVYFIDSSTGYAVGGNGGDKGAILKTTNAGVTWIPQIINENYGLLSVSFVNANVGYAVGFNDDNNGIILKSIIVGE